MQSVAAIFLVCMLGSLQSLSVIVPAFNEEKRLPNTLDHLKSFFASLPLEFLEIVVVDDGSSDATAEVVLARSVLDHRFRLLQNGKNRGKGYAVRNGMLHSRGEWRLITDADLSTPMDELNKLYEAVLRNNAVIAIGSRALDRSLISRRQSYFREFGGRFFNLIMRNITGLPFQDTQCGFKLYRADAAQAVFSRQNLNGFSFDVEDLFIARQLRLKVAEVPVLWANAEGTKVNFRSTLHAFNDLFRIRLLLMRGRYH